jgi:hypothetical protein
MSFVSRETFSATDASTNDVSDNVSGTDHFTRCPLCWRWFDRSNALAVSGHRGPLPHRQAARCVAWADEDE